MQKSAQSYTLFIYARAIWATNAFNLKIFNCVDYLLCACFVVPLQPKYEKLKNRL